MTLVGALITDDRVYLGADRAQQRLDTESGCVWDYEPIQKLAQVPKAPLIWAYFGNTWIGERFRDHVRTSRVPERWRDFADIYGGALRDLNHRRDKGPYAEVIFVGRLEGRFNYLELSQDGLPLGSKARDDDPLYFGGVGRVAARTAYAASESATAAPAEDHFRRALDVTVATIDVLMGPAAVGSVDRNGHVDLPTSTP